MLSFFGLFFAFFLFLKQVKTNDSFSTYIGDNADAMDYHAGSNLLVFSTPNYEVKFINTLTKLTTKTISTDHFFTIQTVKLSSDASLLFTGGRDYRFFIFDTATDVVLCTHNQLRGDIRSATIFDDQDRFAFVTNEGYLYYGNITDCLLNYAVILDKDFSQIISVDANDQVWFVDRTSDILYSITLPAFVVSTYTFSTSVIRSVFHIPSTTTIGVCTQHGFHIIDYSGNQLFSYENLNVLTYKCTITDLGSNQYALTAISEQQIIRYQNSNEQYLWNIWKLTISPSYSMQFVHEQSNQGNRYGSDQPLDAFTLSLSSNILQVASIASGYDPYENIFGSIIGCGQDGIYNSGAGLCQFCVQAIPSCKKCSNTPQCQQCYPFTYLDASKNCVACPDNCYRCTSNTVCKSCIAGYVWKSNDCVLHNITWCGTAEWSSSHDVSRCVQCQIGYYVSQGQSCHICSLKFLNCTQCTDTLCTKCNPGFYMPDPATGYCQACSMFNQGCASCVNSSFCQTCYDEYPVYQTISATQRYCKQGCYYLCQQCNRDQYDQCTLCNENMTLSGTTCVCNVTEYIVDPDSLACIACRDYISDCQNCSSITYCDTCDSGFYFNNISASQQTCKACNYTCLTCDTYWFKCATCDTGNNYRVLDTTTHQCLCPIVTRFQMSGNLICQLCRDHLTSCDTCYNQTFCLKCDNGYYIHTISAGNNQCRACSDPCKQCYNSDSNCTQCYSGRILNQAAGTCDCLYGYYANGTLTCDACHNVLGGCQNCNDNMTCLLCWPNNYFYMDGTKKKCGACKSTCQTCNIWTNICNDCDSSAHRTFNAGTNECDCQTGYIQTDGLCLDCSGTFQHCNSCDLSRCYSCDEGFSLAYEGLKCIQCDKTYPGCIKCINGVCAACNESAGYELSVTSCICSPGYYYKQLQCIPYAMGKVAQRKFPVYQKYQQMMENDSIKITIYFQCEGIYMPYGFQNSVNFSINNQQITNFTYYFDNTTLFMFYIPEKEYPKSEIVVQFKNKTIFDLKQYHPKRRIFTFSKNIYINSTYQLSTNFQIAYSTQIIQNIRWIFTIFLILGSSDVIISLVFVIHFLPAFLLLDLGIPPPLKNVLQQMMTINKKSLFVLSDIDLNFEDYGNSTQFGKNYGLQQSIIDIKIIDFIVIASFSLFYGLFLPYIFEKLDNKLPNSKLKEILHHKIILKRYSTLSNIIICFIPSFLLPAVINFGMQQHNSSLMFSVGFSIFMITAAGAFVFFHLIALLNTQYMDAHKNQDCYMGSSPLETRSILYILSPLFLIGWGIPLLSRGIGIFVLPAMLATILFHIWCFRNWNNFPSKVSYFIKLFIAIFLFFYIGAFLAFEVAENYDSISIDALEVIGLATLVHVIILLSLAYLQAVFLILLALYRFYKISCERMNFIQNLDAERQENIPDQVTGMSQTERRKIQKKINKDKKITDKRQHMKYFKEKHFQATRY